MAIWHIAEVTGVQRLEGASSWAVPAHSVGDLLTVPLKASPLSAKWRWLPALTVGMEITIQVMNTSPVYDPTLLQGIITQYSPESNQVVIRVTSTEIPGGGTWTFTFIREAKWYFCDGPTGFLTEPTDTPANHAYWNALHQPVDLTWTAFTQLGAGGEVEADVGEVILNNDDGKLAHMALWGFRQQKIRVLRAETEGEHPPALSDFTPIFTGIILQATVGEQTVRLVPATSTPELDKELTTKKFDGAGSLNGTASLADRRLPVVYGRAMNVRLVEVDPTRRIFVLNDRAIHSVGGVWDGGSPLTAGADYTTTTDLLNTVPAAGTYRIFKGNATTPAYIRVGSSPAMVLTADINECADTVDDLATTIQRALSERTTMVADVDYDSSYLDSIKAAWPGGCGIYYEEGSVKVRDMISKLVASFIGTWWVDGVGFMKFGRLTKPAAGTKRIIYGPTDKPMEKGPTNWVFFANSYDVSPPELSVNVKVFYQKSYHVMTQFAGVASSTFRTFNSVEWRQYPYSVALPWYGYPGAGRYGFVSADWDESTEIYTQLREMDNPQRTVFQDVFAQERSRFTVSLPWDDDLIEQFNLMDHVVLETPWRTMETVVLARHLNAASGEVTFTLWGGSEEDYAE